MLVRFRWFLWKWVYLSIIKTIGFDVWILSSIREYGKFKVIFCLLVPLLLYLVWGVFQHIPISPISFDVPETIKSATSLVLTIWSFLFSTIFSYLVHEEKEEVIAECESCGESYSMAASKIFSIFWSLAGVISAVPGWFVRHRSDSSGTQYEYEGSQYYKSDENVDSYQPSREEMNSLKEFIKNSIHESKADNVKKELKLQNEMKSLQLELQSLSRIVGKLDTYIQKQEQKYQKKENNALTTEYMKDIDHLHDKFKSLETRVLEELKSWSDKQLRLEDIMVLLEKHFLPAFRTIVNGDADLASKYDNFFNENAKFVFHKKLMQEINALKKQSDYVKKVIELYDKTGQADYALESGGGTVIGTRCTETYGMISFFGIPFGSIWNSPRTAIHPDVHPGDCWAFKGSQGFLVLGLAATIFPSGFTMEHIPVSLSTTGSIDSAPKGFSVWGLESYNDSKGTLLGDYEYDINGDPLQYFPVQKPSEQPYTYIELRIHSNHGKEYTCLYRFRVHGQRHA